ncbi:MAG: helix-turn-helix domain-containing protein, partial [Lachnospiraceae bacterium]|nr:helix-turn-helix domain-containing protein [Lachnospiraceae bacterium]
MAVYADDLPDGVDIRFNTSKADGTPLFKENGAKDSIFKSVKEGQENPFGANIKPEESLTKAQRHYIGDDGQEHLSALNIVKEEGDVNAWSRNLPSQFLSKQSPELAKQQLRLAYEDAKAEYDEIRTCTNPTVQAKMLNDFAGQCESDSVHLKAAALPRQHNKLVLPLTDIRENEIFAPGYSDGEQVALVRFPHGSRSEIPILTVNNNSKNGKNIIGTNAIDAVGIHPKAAQQLSGADFDGDTALVIPTSTVKIAAKKQFKELEGFDTKKEYPGYDGMHVMTPHQKGVEMGKVSNLLTDMTLQGAPDNEICRALKHSMVVVDAEKHKLDFRRSERENGIAELRERYQPEGGASTLISRSTRDYRVDQRKEKAPSKMSAEELARYKNGEIVYEYTGKTYRKTSFPPSKMTKEEKVKWKSGDPELQKEVRAAMYADGRAKIENLKKVQMSKEG